ncbi:MAG: hypothetical protein ACKV22_25770 [Bryobacteraceae bacterium]
MKTLTDNANQYPAEHEVTRMVGRPDAGINADEWMFEGKLILWTLALLILGTAHAAVTNIRVLGVTNTQAVIQYTAPDMSACTLAVSESASYSPVVHDVNGTYFTGDDLDSRTGALTRGRERTVVIGKRSIERATSGVAYSRALQTATTHYYRISCGSDMATGTFSTATIPFGDTHGDPFIPDQLIPGEPMRITPVWERNSTWIDPHTGALHKAMMQPQDNGLYQNFLDLAFSSVLESTNWTDAGNVLAVDAAYATYSGASCGGTCDWLKLSRNAPLPPIGYNRLDLLKVSLLGSGDDATAANRTVEICPVTMGATTIDVDGVCKDIILPQTTPAKVTTSVSGLVDTWRVAGKHEITITQAVASGHYRFAVRKKNSTGNISIDAIRIDIHHSTSGDVGTGGMFDRCSANTRTDNDGERYLCSNHNPGGMMSLYSVHAITGDSRFLGAMWQPGQGGMNYDHTIWDSTNPNVLYGHGGSATEEYKITYTGDGSAKAINTLADLTFVAIRTAGANEKLGPGMAAFVAAHSAEYGGRVFDPTAFNCNVGSAQGDYLIVDCQGQQDTLDWIGVYRLSTSTIVAVQPQFASPGSRWCVAHTRSVPGNVAVSESGPTFAKDYSNGNGIFRSTLVGNITSGTVNVTVTSTCGGDASCAAHVTGEPVSTFTPNYLQVAEVGDLFYIGTEFVRITAKTDATHWTIERGVDVPGLATNAAAHNSGATFDAHCSQKPSSGPWSAGQYEAMWDFIGDPYGMDATGTYVWGNANNGGHLMSRNNVYVVNKSVATSAEGTSIITTQKDLEFTQLMPEAGTFAGKQPPGPGNTWEQHPSIHQEKASEAERQFFYDIRPFVGADGISPQTPGCSPTAAPYPTGCAAARVAGLSNVYRFITNDTDGITPKHLALFGVSNRYVLRDVSGPGSSLDDSAGKDLTFCHVVVAGECVAGSSAGQIYAQVPNLTTYFYCVVNQNYDDLCIADYMAYGNALVQYGFINNMEGLYNSWYASPPAVHPTGLGWTRKLSAHGLNQPYRRVSGFLTGKPLANGRWLLATDWDRGFLVLVKIPPIIKDTVNRSTFLPVAHKIGSAPAGTHNVIVEFGYAEHGTPSQFYCTSRAEACVAVGAAVNETTPFYWSSESYSGLACASGCTITIPVYPSRVVYYRVKYRDSAGTVLLTGPTEVAVAY